MAGIGLRGDSVVMAAKWEGIAAARKQFARLPEVVRQQINEAVDVTRKAALEGARARVPVDTGALKKSLRSTMDKRRGAAKVTARAPHAHLVEFGTVHMDAHPFMLPAAEAERDNFVRRATEAGRRIEQEMKER